MPGVLHWTKDIQNAFPSLLRGVWAEKDRGLVDIDFLPRGRFIAAEDVNKMLAFLDRCFAKKEAIVSKEEVSKGRPASADSNSIYLLFPGNFMRECREAFSTKKKEVGGKGVPLPMPLEGVMFPQASPLIITE